MFDKLGKSKDRRTLLKLVKEHFPETAIPEIDAAAPLEARLGEIEKRLADREEQRTRDRAERTIAEARAKLRADGWDDDGIEKIESFMRERSVPDYDAAAAYIRSTLPKEAPLPSTFAGQRMNWFAPPKEDVDHALLMKNPRAFQDQMVSKWLGEQRGRRGQ
ncbi:MAG TPA: hypothetical protein VME41_16705 [Stellaceae bacterium]|nr:hypothetical protein [Stellaceae bacterium]